MSSGGAGAGAGEADGDLEYRRAAHVVGEIERVKPGDRVSADVECAGFGELMFASHESSRTNFENSTRGAGCAGAHRAGGGGGVWVAADGWGIWRGDGVAGAGGRGAGGSRGISRGGTARRRGSSAGRIFARLMTGRGRAGDGWRGSSSRSSAGSSIEAAREWQLTLGCV